MYPICLFTPLTLLLLQLLQFQHLLFCAQRPRNLLQAPAQLSRFIGLALPQPVHIPSILLLLKFMDQTPQCRPLTLFVLFGNGQFVRQTRHPPAALRTINSLPVRLRLVYRPAAVKANVVGIAGHVFLSGSPKDIQTAKSKGKSEISFRRLPSTIMRNKSKASPKPASVKVFSNSYKAK